MLELAQAIAHGVGPSRGWPVKTAKQKSAGLGSPALGESDLMVGWYRV